MNNAMELGFYLYTDGINLCTSRFLPPITDVKKLGYKRSGRKFIYE